MLIGDTCCKKWIELRKRFEKAMEQYKNIHSGDEFPIDIDWLVITEMQFMNDHVENRSVLSTIDIPTSSSAFLGSPSTSSSNVSKERLRDEQVRFAGPLFSKKPRKKQGSIWSTPWKEKEKLHPFQDVLPEKVPELDDFAKGKLAKRNELTASVKEFGNKLEEVSKKILDSKNELCIAKYSKAL